MDIWFDNGGFVTNFYFWISSKGFCCGLILKIIFMSKVLFWSQLTVSKEPFSFWWIFFNEIKIFNDWNDFEKFWSFEWKTLAGIEKNRKNGFCIFFLQEFLNRNLKFLVSTPRFLSQSSQKSKYIFVFSYLANGKIVANTRPIRIEQINKF